MQNLLDLQAFKKALSVDYKNVQDLFESCTSESTITKDSMKNLFLLHQERNEEIDLIGDRIGLPLTFEKFLTFFRQNKGISKHK